MAASSLHINAINAYATEVTVGPEIGTACILVAQCYRFRLGGSRIIVVTQCNMHKIYILILIRAEDGVSNIYYLYTLENPIEPEILDPTVPFSRYSNFKITDNTVILVHGHRGSVDSDFNTLIKDAILSHQQPHNVIVVDWSKEANQGYTAARQSVPLVAHHLANFINWLETEARLIRSTLHLVGFNLGAHIVGQAGRQLDQGLGRVGRITGLDPAASRWGSDSGRLADSDAMYVEVIHTDITGPGSNGIGTAIGDINFFVNGGRHQPGCFGHICNNNRAYEVFAASMSNSELIGYPCSTDLQNTFNRCEGDPLQMGGLVLSKTGSRKYRVNTSGSWPYSVIDLKTTPNTR